MTKCIIPCNFQYFLLLTCKAIFFQVRIITFYLHIFIIILHNASKCVVQTIRHFFFPLKKYIKLSCILRLKHASNVNRMFFPTKFASYNPPHIHTVHLDIIEVCLPTDAQLNVLQIILKLTLKQLQHISV